MQTVRKNTNNLYLERGFTLVELLISILIGTILAAGLMQIFSNTRQAFITSTNLGLIIENANAAITNLTTVAGFARHQGALADPTAAVTNGLNTLFMGCWKDQLNNFAFANVLGTNMTYQECFQAATQPCYINPPGTTMPYKTDPKLGCPASQNYPPKNCNLQTMVIGGTTYFSSSVFNNFALQNYNGTTGVCFAGNNRGDPLRYGSVACSKAPNINYVFTVQGTASGFYYKPSTEPIFLGQFMGTDGYDNNVGFPSDTLVITYQGDSSCLITDCLGNVVDQYTVVANRYSIQKDSKDNPYLACSVTTMNTMAANPTPNTSKNQKIAAGVQAFRVMFGIDTDAIPDGSPNQYVLPSYFQAGGFATSFGSITLHAKQQTPKIVGVKIALLMRTDKPITSVADKKTYTLLNSSNVHGPYNDNYFRRLYVATLTSNECLPPHRADCAGAEFAAFTLNSKMTSAGYIKPNMTIWFSNQPVMNGSNNMIYGCYMDANATLFAMQKNVTSSVVNQSSVGVPYITPWGGSTSPDGNFRCNYR